MILNDDELALNPEENLDDGIERAFKIHNNDKF